MMYILHEINVGKETTEVHSCQSLLCVLVEPDGHGDKFTLFLHTTHMVTISLCFLGKGLVNRESAPEKRRTGWRWPSAKSVEANWGTGKKGGKTYGLDVSLPEKSMWGHSGSVNTQMLM